MLDDDEDNATTLTLMIFAVLATALGWYALPRCSLV